MNAMSVADKTGLRPLSHKYYLHVRFTTYLLRVDRVLFFQKIENYLECRFRFVLRIEARVQELMGKGTCALVVEHCSKLSTFASGFVY